MGQIDDATIAEIEQEMAGDGVWIDPVFAASHDISAAEEAAIEDAVAAAQDATLRVVLIEVDASDERFHGNFQSLAAWLHDDLGGDATYVGHERSALGVILQAYGDQPDTDSVDNVARHEHPDDAAAQVLRASELIDQGTAEQLWQDVPREEKYPWTAEEGQQGSHQDGTDVGDILLGLGGVALAGAAIAAGVIGWRRRHRQTHQHQHRQHPRAAGFVLPRTVLHTVRSAEDRRLRQRAEAEVLALGEALGAGESGRSASALDAWQQALDHYAAARSILSQEAAAPADVVGALVLARRGEDARTTAQSATPSAWQPPVPCWFNPLHDGPAREVTWRGDGRAVVVPACHACAAEIEAGREPADVLDFIEGDETVHYFRLDLGPWSATGYGALDGKLLDALRSSR